MRDYTKIHNDFAEKIKEKYNGILSVVSQYIGRKHEVTVKCNKHNYTYTLLASRLLDKRTARVPLFCPQCKEEYYAPRLKTICAYCGKPIDRSSARAKNSKSGLYFCCREHKNLSQRISSGAVFDVLRPEHYGVTESRNTYRKNAFAYYSNECANCGWNEDPDVLEVHHIDENRSHNKLENLIILCPTCHKKLTLHKYKLTSDRHIVKITDNE